MGEDNFIEPGEYDGRQPTIFPPGRGAGVFTVTVPGDFAESRGRVVWTLRTGGETHSVPGWTISGTYRLGYLPMGMGSYPPVLKFEEDGPSSGARCRFREIQERTCVTGRRREASRIPSSSRAGWERR